MRGITINHNKLKNTGILFESLVRQITSDVLEGQVNSHALSILKKYFSGHKELGKELQLYHACMNADRLSESRAMQFLDMIISQRKKIDEIKLAKEKYELVKELKESYNLEDFLSCKIPTYRLHASIYKTFMAEARHNSDSILNIQDVASARFTLLEHLLGHGRKVEKQESALLEEFKNQTEDLRLLTYKILIDKFNEKYEVLDDKQKTLLREFINDSSSKNTLLTYIQQEVPILQKELRSRTKNVKDKVIQIKLNEVIAQLDTIGKKKIVRDNEITALMVAYEIARELQS